MGGVACTTCLGAAGGSARDKEMIRAHMIRIYPTLHMGLRSSKKSHPAKYARIIFQVPPSSWQNVARYHLSPIPLRASTYTMVFLLLLYPLTSLPHPLSLSSPIPTLCHFLCHFAKMLFLKMAKWQSFWHIYSPFLKFLAIMPF